MFSYETIESLKDTPARWATMRMIRNSAAFAANKDSKVAEALRVPGAEIYAIDVSFSAPKDKKEFDYLNLQPTTFVLEPEAVDRLRAAGGTIIEVGGRRKACRDNCAIIIIALPQDFPNIPDTSLRRSALADGRAWCTESEVPKIKERMKSGVRQGARPTAYLVVR